MANIKNPLFSLDARGSLSKAISFVRRRGQNIAEKKPEILDVQSTAQLTWRTMFLMARDLWHDLSAAEKRNWETAGSIRHMTGYAWFMSQALRPNPGIYLPLLGGTMQGNIDMADHRILQLPLPINVKEPATKAYHDNVANLPVHGVAKHTDVTRYKFIPAVAFAQADVSSGWYHSYVVFANGASNLLSVEFRCPDDFVSITSFQIVLAVQTGAGGNLYIELKSRYAADGEVVGMHNEEPGFAVTPIAAPGASNVQVKTPGAPLTYASLSKNDYVGLVYTRDAINVLDTFEEDSLLLGFLFTYIAEQ